MALPLDPGQVSSPAAAVVVIVAVLASSLTTVMTRALVALGKYKSAKQRRLIRARMARHRLQAEQTVTAAYEDLIAALREQLADLQKKYDELDTRCQVFLVRSQKCEEADVENKKLAAQQALELGEQKVLIAELRNRLPA